MRFTAVMAIRDGNPFIAVSATRATRLKPGWRKPMPVVVRIDNKPAAGWRINMMPAGDGSFYLYLHGAVRKASGTGVGDRVQVDVTFDAAYKGGPQELPDWFAKALAQDKLATANWRKLAPSRQKEIARYLGGLKSDAGKARNLEKAMRMLGGKPTRWLAREWKDAS